MYYRICPNCGATLDPGEECNCTKEDYIEELKKCPTTGTTTTAQEKADEMKGQTIRKATAQNLNATESES